jgi:hypothetical protein
VNSRAEQLASRIEEAPEGWQNSPKGLSDSEVEIAKCAMGAA